MMTWTNAEAKLGCSIERGAISIPLGEIVSRKGIEVHLKSFCYSLNSGG